MNELLVDDEVLRPTRVFVDLGRIAANLDAIRQQVGPSRQVMPILKANAYGHGLLPVAREMEQQGVPLIGLAFLEEAIAVRKAGVRTPILVLGGILGDQIPLFLKYDLQLTASSVDKLRAIDAAAAENGVRAAVHLKIDTGMERIGIHWYNAEKLLEASLQCRHVDVRGIFSHLASSDERDPTFTRLQLERFLEVVSFYERRSVPTPMRHLANSGAILAHPDTWLDAVRPGILLFGVYPSSDVVRSVPVRPALTWTSRVVYFKVVEAGHPVSYGSTWTPTEQTRIVTIPVGYGDGYPRALSNRSEVVIAGRRYPVVGRVCMDQLMVNLGSGSAWNGDEVVLLGEDVTAEELSRWAGTIPYEILTGINTRVPRVHTR